MKFNELEFQGRREELPESEHG